jgi:hypothetical protein
MHHGQLAVHIGEAGGMLVPRLGESGVGGFARELHGTETEPPQGDNRRGSVGRKYVHAVPQLPHVIPGIRVELHTATIGPPVDACQRTLVSLASRTTRVMFVRAH